MKILRKRVSQVKLLIRKPSAGEERKVSNTTQLKIDAMNLNSQRKPNRKVLNIAKNRVRDKKKRKIKIVNGIDERTDTVDRISELPEPIIHHILSFLRCPKDAARISVLSKRWRSIWDSFLVFDFDQKNFKAQGGLLKETFKNFIENSLSTRLAPLVSIQKFRLFMTSFESKLAPYMDSWLCAATTKNVKELEIHVEIKKRIHYSLPQFVLAAETLTTLKLYGCKLDNCNDIKLPRLQQLSIKKVHVKMNLIRSFIHSCPCIEDFRLIYCTGLDCLHVSTLLKLNRIEVHECRGLKGVEIAVPNLETFWFSGKRSVPCTINLEGCQNLKSLTLIDTHMTDELFHDQIFKFPVLENLVLNECGTLEKITILSQKLTRLALIRCNKLLEAIIDAPNLHSLEYTGHEMPFSSVNAPNLQETKLYFVSKRKDEYILQSFLEKFSQSKGFKLVVRQNKDVIIHEELRDVQPLPFMDLKLDINKSSTILTDLVDSTLRDTHPQSVSVISSSSSEFLKFLYEKIMNREENLNCCRYYSRKCWRHYLKHVAIAENEWTSAGNPSSNSSSTLHKTTFSLKWGSMEGGNAMKD